MNAPSPGNNNGFFPPTNGPAGVGGSRFFPKIGDSIVEGFSPRLSLLLDIPMDLAQVFSCLFWGLGPGPLGPEGGFSPEMPKIPKKCPKWGYPLF